MPFMPKLFLFMVGTMVAVLLVHGVGLIAGFSEGLISAAQKGVAAVALAVFVLRMRG